MYGSGEIAAGSGNNILLKRENRFPQKTQYVKRRTAPFARQRMPPPRNKPRHCHDRKTGKVSQIFDF